MRKVIIACALLLVVLGLSACTGVMKMNPERLKIDKAYVFTADIRSGELSAVADFERVNSSEWQVVLREPFALEGLVLTYTDGEITAVYDNLRAEMVGDMSVYGLVIAAFENAVNGEGREVVSSRDEITVTSKAGTAGVSYTLVLDKSSLEPKTLEMPAANLSCGFTEVRVNEVQTVIV